MAGRMRAGKASDDRCRKRRASSATSRPRRPTYRRSISRLMRTPTTRPVATSRRTRTSSGRHVSATLSRNIAPARLRAHLDRVAAARVHRSRASAVGQAYRRPASHDWPCRPCPPHRAGRRYLHSQAPHPALASPRLRPRPRPRRRRGCPWPPFGPCAPDDAATASEPLYGRRRCNGACPRDHAAGAAARRASARFGVARRFRVRCLHTHRQFS